MTSPVEKRLRHALRQEADTVDPPDDAWARIRARVEPEHRRLDLLRPRVVLAAGAAVALLAVVMAAMFGGGGDTRVQVTTESARLYLAPAGVDGYDLVYAVIDPEGASTGPAGEMRVFGRRAPDGVALSASVVVMVPADPFAGDVEERTLRVGNAEVPVYGDELGRRIVRWPDDDGRTVGVATFGLGDEELAAVVASLQGGPALEVQPSLPPGFAEVHRGQMPMAPFRLTDQNWQSSDGRSFSVTVVDVPGIALDMIAGEQPGGHAVDVRGTTGIVTDADLAVLSWIERPGTLVQIMSPELDEAALRRIAEGLRVIDEGAWKALYATAERHELPRDNLTPIPGEAPPNISGDSFLLVRPVLRRVGPPCAAVVVGHSAAVLPEVREGEEVACFEVGPPGLEASDVARARAGADQAGGLWHVELTLSARGASRADALARMVGAGGQLAVVVDGRVVSAPVLATSSLRGPVMVTGLDERSARDLAGRLG
jgi:hypothetical protein